jgi:uncharacterized protein (DUF433 family)
MARDNSIDLVVLESVWSADEKRMWAAPENKVTDAERDGGIDLIRLEISSSANTLRLMEWSIECALASADLMRECVVVDPEIRGGRPVLLGTGFTVAQTLAELADSSGVEEVADNFSLNTETIRKLLNALSLRFEQSWVRRP